jgi:hypothetical protein
MIRTRVTWVIVGAVVALVVVAGVDSLRSSDKASAPTTTESTTTGERAASTLPRCTREQIGISIEIWLCGTSGPIPVTSRTQDSVCESRIERGT